MQKTTITLLAGALLLVAGGGVILPQLFADPATPLVRWHADDELDVPLEPADPTAADSFGDAVAERSAVALADPPAGNDERVDVRLRGRVVDPFRRPVAAATVWLDFGRGGGRGRPAADNRQRRVPDPVQTDAEGRFAFEGQTFRMLRVSLQVAHARFAPGMFDQDVGAVAAEVDLGDLMLRTGGEVRGRVTDLDGNGIPGALLVLQGENGNPLRMLRDRERLLPTFTADQNGFFRRPHLAAGDWSLSATAKRHTEARSAVFVVEDEQAVEIEDIRLGPGYELTGTVMSVRGEAIAKANVVLQTNASGRPAGGRGPNPAGREHRAVTDDAGKFAFEHLPGTNMRLRAEAAGFLELRQQDLDPKLGQPLHLTLQDGLRIEGVVRDGDGAPVPRFAVRAVWLRGLPQPGQAPLDPQSVLAQLQSGSMDEGMRAQLRNQFEQLRGPMQGAREAFGRGGGGRGGDGGRDGQRDLGRPEDHPDGRFTVTGLQEGVYELHVQSPDHARLRTAELELRSGAAPPRLSLTLDQGIYVAGVVLDHDGEPVRGANVELRVPGAFEGDGGRGQRPAGQAGIDANGLAREFLRAAAGMQLTLETTTDRDGVFVLKHVPRGTWRLQARARGHAAAETEAFELISDRSGLELRLGALGAIAGTVRGLRADEAGTARVAAIQVNGSGRGGIGAIMGRGRGGGEGPFQSAAVDADGSYRLEGLVPGDYVVRSWIGSPQDLMRELMPRFADGSLQPDAVVRAAAVTPLDLVLSRPQLGIVAGNVRHNGAAASGFRVELVRADDGAGSEQGGWPGRGRGAMAFGRTLQATVSPSGRFQIVNVPAGSWRLRVQAGRRAGVLHEELVQVVADVTVEVDLPLLTSSVQGRVTLPDGGDPTSLNGRVSLLPGLTAMPPDPAAWQRANGGFDARLQAAAFQFESVKQGAYLLVVSPRGREPTALPVVLSGDQSVTVVAGPVVTPTGAGAPQAPAPARR